MWSTSILGEMFFTLTIRRLKVAEHLDYLNHLLRLDPGSRRLRFNFAASDAAVQAHCLRRAISGGPILGALVGHEVRGAIEIDRIDRPDCNAMELALSVEKEYQRCGLGTLLLASALQQVASARAVLLCWSGNTGMVRLASRFGAELMQQGDHLIFTIQTANDHRSLQARPLFPMDLTAIDFTVGYV